MKQRWVRALDYMMSAIAIIMMILSTGITVALCARAYLWVKRMEQGGLSVNWSIRSGETMMYLAGLLLLYAGPIWISWKFRRTMFVCALCLAIIETIVVLIVGPLVAS